MSKKIFTTILPAALLAGLFSMNVQAHSGDGAHVVVSSSGPVMSSAGCVTSSGSGSGSEACGGGEMAKTEMAAPAPAPEAAPAPAPAPAMAPKAMGSAHSHAANHCTNSMVHTHAAPSGHKHSYSCKMAKPRQMAQ